MNREQLNLRAISRAYEEFAKNVKDPSERVDHYIRSDEGLDWSWEKEYKKDGQFQWCGAFAAYCHQALLPEIRKKYMPSTYRLFKWASRTDRHIDPSETQPGDVCITTTAKCKKRWGKHITLCVDRVSDTHILTLEGNAWGHFPNSEYGQGVISRKRCLVPKLEASWVMHVYRFDDDDFDIGQI